MERYKETFSFVSLKMVSKGLTLVQQVIIGFGS